MTLIERFKKNKLMIAVCIATSVVVLVGCHFRLPALSCAAMYVPIIVAFVLHLTSKHQERAAKLASVSDEKKAIHHALEELEFYAGAPGIADEYLDSLPSD